MRVLAITNLFPSNVDPAYAPFNRQQFAELAKQVDLEVFGVVPWRFGRWYAAGSTKDVVRAEQIDGIPVLHPRYPPIPGLPSLNAALYAGALLPELWRRSRARRFDVLLAAYAYPDGCAGVALGGLLGAPVVVKCHGSDLNRVPDDPPARAQLRALLPRADAVVVVSEKLGERARALGVRAERLHVVYNGVDRARFPVADRAEARARLGLPGDRRLVVFVGHLAEHKGARDLLEAAGRLGGLAPAASIVFVGDGPLLEELRGAARGRAEVIVAGRVPHAEVAAYLAASDVLCLPSWDEGMPNVVREAHACGRPVVATRVGGIPEAISAPVLGRLVPPRDPPALALALREVLCAPAVAPQEIVAAAVVPTWTESAAALRRVLEVAAANVRAR